MSIVRHHLRRGPQRALAGATATLLVLAGASGPALANPGDGTPGGLTGAGTVTVTTPGPVAEGSTITIQGIGFEAGAGGSWQTVSVKIDAIDNANFYKGSALLSPNGVVATFPLQADGTFTGTLVIPADINDPAVNPGNAAGPHWLRVLGSNPPLSRWSNDFVTVDAPPTDPLSEKIKKVRAKIQKAKKAHQTAKVKKLKKKLKRLKKRLRQRD